MRKTQREYVLTRLRQGLVCTTDEFFGSQEEVSTSRTIRTVEQKDFRDAILTEAPHLRYMTQSSLEKQAEHGSNKDELEDDGCCRS